MICIKRLKYCLACLPVSLWATDVTLSLANNTELKPVIKLVRDTGFDCPKYSISIFSSGAVLYEPISNPSDARPTDLLSSNTLPITRKPTKTNSPISDDRGASKAQITLASLEDLKTEFRQMKFFEIRPMQFNAEKGTTIYDCKLDWEYLRQFATYAKQCAVASTVEIFSRSNHNLIGDALFFKDGATEKEVRLFRTMDRAPEINALQYRIDQLVDSKQWTGQNKCISPKIGGMTK